MDFHIGKIINSIRMEKNISMARLGGKLYGKGMLHKVEQEGMEPGKWVTDVLLERLGADTNKFGCLYLAEELKEFQYRESLLFLLRQGEMKELRVRWQEASHALDNAKRRSRRGIICQQQFLIYIRLISYYSRFGCLDEVPCTTAERLQLVRDALGLTLPTDCIEHLEDTLFSRIEHALVALYADLLCQDATTRDEGVLLFHRLLQQVETQITDQEELCFQYAHIAALALRRLATGGDYTANEVCEKVLALLQKHRKLYGMITLLHYQIEADPTSPENQKRQCQLDSLEFLAGADLDWFSCQVGNWKQTQLADFLDLGMPNFRGLSLGESVRKIRKVKNLSQNELSENICDPRTVLRMEKGKDLPNAQNYRELMGRLGQEGYRYIPQIVSEKYEMHELRKQVASKISIWKYEEAEKGLTELEKGLDMSEPLNRQYIMSTRTSIEAALGRIDMEERLRNLENALRLTVPEGTDVKNWPFKRTELVIINKIANAKEAMGKTEEAEILLTNVIRACENVQERVEQNVVQYLLAAYNLERYLDKNDKHEEAVELSVKALQKAYVTGSGGGVVEFIFKIAWNLECMYDNEIDGKQKKRMTCLPMYKQAMLIAEALDYSFYKNSIRQHCLQEYQVVL